MGTGPFLTASSKQLQSPARSCHERQIGPGSARGALGTDAKRAASFAAGAPALE